MSNTALIASQDGDARAAADRVDERESVTFLRRPQLPDVELMSVRGATRLWRFVTHGFMIGACDPDHLDGVFAEERYQGRWETRSGLDVAFYEPQEPIVTRRIGAPMTGHVFVLTPERVAQELRELGDAGPPRFTNHVSRAPALHALFCEAWRAFEDDALDAIEQEHRLRRFFVAALGFAATPADAPVRGCAPTAQRVRELLHDRFADPLTLNTIAEALGRSKYHLEHAFKEALGLPIHEYLQRVRIERAMALLRAGRRPRDVAKLVGLADQPHLNRLFRNVIGVTPGAYARAMRPRA